MKERVDAARRYASTAALECLGETHREATCLFQHYYEAFYEETRHVDAWGDTERGVTALEKELLKKKIAQPLSACSGLFRCKADDSFRELAPLSAKGCYLGEESQVGADLACLQWYAGHAGHLMLRPPLHGDDARGMRSISGTL